MLEKLLKSWQEIHEPRIHTIVDIKIKLFDGYCKVELFHQNEKLMVEEYFTEAEINSTDPFDIKYKLNRLYGGLLAKVSRKQLDRMNV